MSEQQATSKCPHPEAVGKRWGDPISTERKAELQGYLDHWSSETGHSERKGPFHGVNLAGADVSWLADQSGRESVGRTPNLHLEGAEFSAAHEEYLERVQTYQSTAARQKARRKRQVRVEPLFAEAKAWHGLRRFRLRSLWRVNCEALLVAAGQNLKRLLTQRG
jgi:hypothetical protein